MSPPKIHLNFLEINPQAFSYVVFRKPYNVIDLNEQVHKYRLPQKIGDQEFNDYCVSFEQIDDFEAFVCQDNTNKDLTLKIIH